MYSRILAAYHRQMFFPGWFGPFVNPFFFARNGLINAMTEFSATLSGRLLDVGCGTKPYKSLFCVETYTGLDIDSRNSRSRGIADIYYDGTVFPIPDASYDSVLCNQVLEHVFNPDDFLREINRVLKPGGRLLLTVPFVWDEHEQPYDYARYTSFGLFALLDRAGFRVIKHKKSCNDITAIFQLVNAYLYKVIQRFPSKIKLLITFTLMATINLIGLMSKRLLPANHDLYLDHIVLAEKS